MRARSFVVPVPTKRAKKDIVDSTTFNTKGAQYHYAKKAISFENCSLRGLNSRPPPLHVRVRDSCVVGLCCN